MCSLFTATYFGQYFHFKSTNHTQSVTWQIWSNLDFLYAQLLLYLHKIFILRRTEIDFNLLKKYAHKHCHIVKHTKNNNQLTILTQRLLFVKLVCNVPHKPTCYKPGMRKLYLGTSFYSSPIYYLHISILKQCLPFEQRKTNL